MYEPMVTKEQLLAVLPYRDQVVLKEERQDTQDIRSEILAAHKKYAPDYDLIAHYFNTGNIVDTSRQIFDFLKRNVPYKKENGRYQTVKSPAAILLSNGSAGDPYGRVDCKNYALFINGVLDATQRNYPSDGNGWDWCYRFASYNENDPEPGHVFSVVKIDGKELWIDPVFTFFNDGLMHEWEIDERPAIGGLYEISGPADSSGTVSVNTKDAWTNFLICIQNDYFSLPKLMLTYLSITAGPVLTELISLGVDPNALGAVLSYAKKMGYGNG